MNDKVKELLENAEQSDAIAKNKWRIENREQLRKERQEKLKELMEKDKQQTAVEWLIEQFWNNEGMLTSKKLEKALEMEKDQMDAEIIKICAEQSTSEASKYDQGYKEGYKRAVELSKWALSNLIPPYNEQ